MIWARDFEPVYNRMKGRSWSEVIQSKKIFYVSLSATELRSFLPQSGSGLLDHYSTRERVSLLLWDIWKTYQAYESHRNGVCPIKSHFIFTNEKSIWPNEQSNGSDATCRSRISCDIYSNISCNYQVGPCIPRTGLNLFHSIEDSDSSSIAGICDVYSFYICVPRFLKKLCQISLHQLWFVNDCLCSNF